MLLAASSRSRASGLGTPSTTVSFCARSSSAPRYVLFGPLIAGWSHAPCYCIDAEILLFFRRRKPHADVGVGASISATTFDHRRQRTQRGCNNTSLRDVVAPI